MGSTWPELDETELGASQLPSNAPASSFRAQVTATPATLYGLSGYNGNAGDLFLLLFDKTAYPANGTLADCLCVARAGSDFFIDFGRSGRYFISGLLWMVSSTAPTLTASASSLFADLQYVAAW